MFYPPDAAFIAEPTIVLVGLKLASGLGMVPKADVRDGHSRRFASLP
jgi:hypothetical protein